MKSTNLTCLDQTEAETLRARLKLHTANLRGLVHLYEKQLVHPPALTGSDILADIQLLEIHTNELELRLGDKAPEFLVRKTATGDRPKHPSTVAFPPLNTFPEKKRSVTEQLLEAKGVRSIGELTAKNREARLAEQRRKLASAISKIK